MISKVNLNSNGKEYAAKGSSCVLVKKRGRYTEFKCYVGEKVFDFRLANDLVPLYFKSEEVAE